MSRTRNPESTTVVGGLGDPSPYLLRDERVVVAVRRHVMVLVAAFLETVGFILGALMIQALFSYVTAVRTVTLLIALAAVVRFCYLILEWRLERFVITDQRMMLVGGVLTRQVAVMPMRKVTDLTFEKPLVGQIFGYGTFIVESAGQDQALSRIEYLPRANRLYLKVSDLLFGDSKVVQDQDLVIDPPLRRDRKNRRTRPEEPTASDLPAVNDLLVAGEQPDTYADVDRHAAGRSAGDLDSTDPTLGERLAGADYDLSPDEFWASRFGDIPADGSRGRADSHRAGQGALFGALQSQDSAAQRMRDRLGGLNGRGRRRDEAATTSSAIRQRP